MKKKKDKDMENRKEKLGIFQRTSTGGPISEQENFLRKRKKKNYNKIVILNSINKNKTTMSNAFKILKKNDLQLRMKSKNPVKLSTKYENRTKTFSGI